MPFTTECARVAAPKRFEWLRRARGLGVIAILAAMVFEKEAGAAKLRLRVPDSCVEAAAVTEQVDGLLGRPLASVDGVDFDLEIAEWSPRKWHLRLDTIDRAEQRKLTRELSGQSCSELADAAAVAIAMSIKSIAGETERREGTAAAPPRPPPTDPVLGSGSGPGAATAASSRPAAPLPLEGDAAIAVVRDGGALPSPALGLGVEASLQARIFRVAGLATLFPSQSTQLSGGRGGDFQLALVGVLGCAAFRFLDRAALLGCAGGEGGRLSGQGTGVTNPHLGSASWVAARVEVGAVVSLGSRLEILARGGAVFPFSTPTFTIDGTTPVHRSSRVTSRTTVAIGLKF